MSPRSDVSTDLVLRFAGATVDPSQGVLFIDQSNAGADWAGSLEHAAHSGRSFMADVREGRLVFDCDVKSLPDTWAPAARQALIDVGCNVVRAASGTPGSEHWWFVGPTGWSSEDLRNVAVQAGAPAEQLRWGSRDVRPPLSPHRSGLPVSLLEPTDFNDALGMLQVRPRSTRLNRTAIEAILSGDLLKTTFVTTTGRFNRERGAYVLALHLVNAGLDYADYQALIPRSTWLRQKIAALGERWLASKWGAACRRVREHPAVSRSTDSSELAAVVATVDAGPWVGRSGATDQLVYGRLAEIGAEYGLVTVSHSQRSLALAVGLSLSVVNKSVRRLVARGLLEIVEPAKFGVAATYRLRPEPGVTETSSHSPPYLRTVDTCSRNPEFGSVPDLFRGADGLPRATFETWNALDDKEWLIVAEVAARRRGRLRPDTVRDHLRKLHSAGLADRNAPRGQRWLRVARTNEELAKIAVSLGAAGATELQADQYQRDRQAYAPWARHRGAA